MRAASWLLTALSLTAVIGVIAWELQSDRTGPGPLHPAHAADARLQQGANCTACHETGAGVAAARCGDCHAAIATQLERRTGLHGSLPQDQVRNCGTCHHEHHGVATELLGAHAFARAGIDRIADYDHRHVRDFGLTGAHRRLACERCHPAASAAAPPRGGRFLGLAQQCTSCHEDRHAGAYGADCVGCHGQERPFPEVPGFRHERFRLQQAHANRRCDECHPADGAHAVAALQRADAVPVRACVDCHDDPHAPAAAARLGRMAIRDATDCTRCHPTTRFAEHGITGERHDRVGPALPGVHAAVACADCHGDPGRPPRWRGDAPAMTACAACHDSPHRPELLATGCSECHRADDRTFTGATLTVPQHARTAMPLRPPHDRVACTRCHESGNDYRRRHPGRDATACTSCHRDPHGGQFAAEPRWRECTGCHAVDHFRPHGFDVAAHLQTAFPLQRAHTAVACERCHDRVVAGMRQFHGTSSRCADCHRDPHGGRFDGPGKPALVAGRSDCARCHDDGAFAPVVGDFDHARWTGHALTDAHARLQCSQCHAPLPRPDAAGSRLGKALGTACTDCHQDVHRGQFARDGRTDCARCHRPTTFADLRFDHQRDSRFALDQRHAALPCGRCHQATATDTGPVVRYRPLGTACADCHGNQPVRKS